MNVYFSTFISGFGSFISDQLVKDVQGVEVLKVLDGAIVYKSDCGFDQIRKIRYFNNSFLVLQELDFCEGEKNALDKMLDFTISNVEILDRDLLGLGERKRTFRIFTSFENELKSVDSGLLGKVEDLINRRIGLKKDLKNPDCEFWYVHRSENVGFILFRLTEKKKNLKKGELRPELTNLLCLLSEPKDNDIVLDPFAGSGSILLERLRLGGFKGIFALENSEKVFGDLKLRVKNIKSKRIQKSFFVKNVDFFDVKFDEGFFDKIITDPPWGFFEKVEGGIERFYGQMLEKMLKILRIDGRIVLLTAQKEIFEDLLNKYGDKVKLIERYDVLVSGKKAGVYVVGKLSNLR